MSDNLSLGTEMTIRDVVDFVKVLMEQTAVARPGDTVILEVEAMAQEVDELMSQLKPLHEETGVHFLILSSGARLARVERDES